MDVDASERRKIKIYADKKKNAMKKISPASYAQSKCCGRGLKAENFYLQIIYL